MPIIIREEQFRLKSRLTKAGAIVLDDIDAANQKVRPARIGLINLMPAATMEVTELQWLRYMSNTAVQIDPVLIKFDKDFRERAGESRANILTRYIPFSEAKKNGLDGLIITGGNLELANVQKGEQKIGLDFIEFKFYFNFIFIYFNNFIYFI